MGRDETYSAAAHQSETADAAPGCVGSATGSDVAGTCLAEVIGHIRSNTDREHLAPIAGEASVTPEDLLAGTP